MANPNIKSQMTFLWKGVNNTGKISQGEIRASSAAQAKLLLRQQGVTASSVKKKSKALTLGKAAVKAAELSVVTRQMATLLGAGVPLVQSLDLIANGASSDALRQLITQISVKVQTGTPLSEVLGEHKQYFSELYCDLVKSGEQSGALDRVFDRIAIYTEKAQALHSKIKKAMFYPAAVLIVAAIVTCILLVFVVPQFAEVFHSMGAELPAFTQLVLQISQLMQDYWLLFLATLLAIVLTLSKLYVNHQSFRVFIDHLLLRLPVFGSIFNKAAVARFTRTLSTTFAAGVPLIEALESAAGAAGNEVYKMAIRVVREEMMAGNQMHQAMRNTGTFPEMVNQMVAIGEESGALDTLLAKVATIYEQEVDDSVDSLTALLEPLIMTVLGVLIGGLIIAMYLPIFQLGSIV